MVDVLNIIFFAMCYLVVAFVVLSIIYDKRLLALKKEISILINEIEKKYQKGNTNG